MNEKTLIEKLVIKKIINAEESKFKIFKHLSNKDIKYINLISDSILENDEKKKLIVNFNNPINKKELKQRVKEIKKKSRIINLNNKYIQNTQKNELLKIYGKEYANEAISLSNYLGVDDYKEEGIVIDYTKKQIKFVYLIKNQNVNNDQKTLLQKKLYKLCDNLPTKFRILIGITPIEYKEYEKQLLNQINDNNLSEEQKQIKKYQWNLVNTWNTESLINERNTFVVLTKDYNSIKSMENLYIDYQKYSEIFKINGIELNQNFEDIFKGLQSIFNNNETR